MNLSSFIQHKIFSRLIMLYGVLTICFLSISYYGLEKETKRYYQMTSGFITTSTEQLINEGDYIRVQMNIEQFSKRLNESSDFKICPEVYLDNLRIAYLECTGHFQKEQTFLKTLNNSKVLKIFLKIDYDIFIFTTLFKVLIFSMLSFSAFIFIKKSIDHFTAELITPLEKWSNWAQAASFDEDLDPPSFSKEDLHIKEFKNFNEFTQKAFIMQKNFYTLKISEEKALALSMLAREVSHDIRSPLSALKVSIDDVRDLPNDQKEIIHSSFQRISDIANNLLDYSSKKNESAALEVENVYNVVRDIIAEKKLAFRSRDNVELRAEHGESKDYYSLINSAELKRVLSNLINNSFEAIEASGNLTLQLKQLSSEEIIINIIDDGKGMESHVLENLGKAGFTHGKSHNESGHGIGFAHAKKTIESMNGRLSVESTLNVGTTVSIILKSSAAPTSHQSYDYVYIDDDALMLKHWQMRAKKKNIKLLTLKSIKEFDQYVDKLDKELTSIYIDSNLGDLSISGEEFAKSLHEKGYLKLYIASSYEASHFEHFKWLLYSGKDCPF